MLDENRALADNGAVTTWEVLGKSPVGKICHHCRQFKDYSAFTKNGLKYWRPDCNECRAVLRKKYTDQVREYSKRYGETHVEQIKESKTKRRLERQEARADIQHYDLELLAQGIDVTKLSRRCCVCDQEKLLPDFPFARSEKYGRGYVCLSCAQGNQRKYRGKNAEKVAQARQRDKGKRLQYQRERNKKVPPGPSYEAFRQAVFQRDSWVCGLCRDPIDPNLKFPDPMAANIDHKIPLCKGGSHAYDNVHAVHSRCNLEKGRKLQKEVCTDRS